MTEALLLVAGVETQIRQAPQGGTAGVRTRGRIDKGVGLLHAKRRVPVVVPCRRVLRAGARGEEDGVSPFIIPRVRPAIRVFKHAVGETTLEAVEVPIQMLD